MSVCYEILDDLYSIDNGRPSVDPAVLFKLMLIQQLYGIRSLRQTVKDSEVNIVYRWFIGYTAAQPIPHFATISYAFAQRFTGEIVERIFEWISDEVNEAGYPAPEVVFVNGTHIKANANLKKHIKKVIPQTAKRYEKQLIEEINEERHAHGKKPLGDNSDTKPPREKTVTESTSNPECGLFHKGEHRKCFAYEAHTLCGKHNFVLDVEVTPGNIHDSIAFDNLYARVTNRFPKIEVVTAAAAYKTPWICKQIFDDGRVPSLSYKRPMTKKGNLPWYEYVYDEYYDCVLCPQNKVLSYSATNREGYREYRSKSYICKDILYLPTVAQARIVRN